MAITTGRASYARAVTGVGTTSGSAAITGSANSFFANDVGAPISGTGIPAGATVLSVTSGTAATLSANATATGTVTATIGPRVLGGIGWHPESDTHVGDRTFASAAAGTVPLDRITDTNTRTPEYVEH